MINFVALTIFPEMFNSFLSYGIIRKGIEQKKISVSTINIRDFAEGKHRVTDDRPYGGGHPYRHLKGGDRRFGGYDRDRDRRCCLPAL